MIIKELYVNKLFAFEYLNRINNKGSTCLIKNLSLWCLEIPSK